MHSQQCYMHEWLAAQDIDLEAQTDALWRDCLQGSQLPDPPSRSQVDSSKLSSGLHTLESQQKLLGAMVQGITGMSREILGSIRLLKLQKTNINDLLNQLTAMTQAKASLEQLDQHANGKCSLDQLKKFVIGLQSSLDHVPSKYFTQDLEKYKQFTTALEVWLKQKLEESLVARNLSDVNTITSLMGILKVKYDVAQKYEDLISSDLQSKIDEATTALDKQRDNLVSMQRCLSSEDYELTSKKAKEGRAPQIFLDCLVDILSIMMDQIMNLHSNTVMIDSPDTLKKFLVVLLDEKLSAFLNKLKPRMDKFYGLDLQVYASRKDDISISIERDPRTLPKFNKIIDDIVVVEHYLNEITGIVGQIKIFTVDVGKEIVGLVQKVDKEGKKFLQATWGGSEVHRMLQSLSYHTSVLEMTSSCQGAQERTLKGRMAVILSQSVSLRTLFFGDAAAITKATAGEGAALEGSPESVTATNKLADYLEDVLFCIRGSIFRAISSLDKISACTCISFVTNSILCSDLYRLTKQLMQRYLNLAQEGGQGTVGLFTSNDHQNAGAAVILNSMDLVIQLTDRLTKQVSQFAAEQLEGVAEKQEILLIQETGQSMRTQVSKAFRDLLKQSLHTLAEACCSKDLASTMSLYNSFEFSSSDKEFSEYEALPSKWSVGLRLAKKLTGVFVSWRTNLTPDLYSEFVKEVSGSLHSQLMTAVQKKKKFNQLGAIILDKEVQTMIAALERESEVSVFKCFGKVRGACEVLLSHSKEEAHSVAAKHGLTPEEANKLIVKCPDLGLKL